MHPDAKKDELSLLELLGHVYLLRIFVSICGFLITKATLVFYNISATYPFMYAFSYGDTAVFLAFLICFPFFTYNVLRSAFFSNNLKTKWIYLPIAFSLMVFAISSNEYFSHNSKTAFVLLATCAVLLLLSIKYLNVIKKSTTTYAILFTCALLFSTFEIITTLHYNDAFIVESYNENDYIILLDFKEQVYLLRCEIQEGTKLTLHKGDYVLLNKKNLTNYNQEYSKFTEVIFAKETSNR